MSSSDPVTRIRSEALEKFRLEVAPETEAIRAALVAEVQGLQASIIAALKTGELLSLAKARCSHGLWLPYLKAEFQWRSDETARRYRRLFELSTKTTNLLNLKVPQSALYLIATPSTPDHIRDDIMRRAEAGEEFSFDDVATMIAAAKASLRVQVQPADSVTSLAEKRNEQARTVNMQVTSGVVHLMAPVTFAPVAEGTVVSPVYTSPEDSAARRLMDAIEAYGAALTHGKKSALQRAAAGRDKAAIRRCLDIITAAVEDDGA